MIDPFGVGGDESLEFQNHPLSWILFPSCYQLQSGDPGVSSGGVTPVPIPNTAVKPTSADDTPGHTGGKVGQCPGHWTEHKSSNEKRSFLLPQLLGPTFRRFEAATAAAVRTQTALRPAAEKDLLLHHTPSLPRGRSEQIQVVGQPAPHQNKFWCGVPGSLD
jgi:hypothetical protein